MSELCDKAYSRYRTDKIFCLPKVFVLMLFLTGLFSSCISSKLSVDNFVPISESVALNGTYSNKNSELTRLFGLYDVKTDFVKIDYDLNCKDTLKLSYYTDNGLQHSYFKVKKKKNYLEKYFHKKYIPFFPVLFAYDFERIRIGLNADSDLLIHYYQNVCGVVLGLGAGHKDDKAHTFSKIDCLSITLLKY